MDNFIYEKALALVNRSSTGILGTVEKEGMPQQKAMLKTESKGLKEFWFCSNTSSKRVQQIKDNPRASLYFYDEKNFEGLMLIGIAEISQDDDKRKKFWHEEMRMYYPLGYNDPDFVLAKFTAFKGNYYYGLKNYDFDIDEP